jgi:hypothetical protein
MGSKQQAVIFSPCVFTRAGLCTVLNNLRPLHPLDAVFAVATAVQAQQVLSASSGVAILVVHVTPLLLVDEWHAFDSTLCHQGLHCPTLLLYDPESITILPRMPFLSAHALERVDSSVTLHALPTLLLEVMTHSNAGCHSTLA